MLKPDKFKQLKHLSRAIRELQALQEEILDSCTETDLKKLYKVDKFLAYDVYYRLAKEASQDFSYVEVMNDVDNLVRKRKT